MKESEDQKLLDEIIDIYQFTMQTLDQCSPVLFRETRRQAFRDDWLKIDSKLRTIRKEIRNNIQKLENAGLRENQLRHKVEWLREAKELYRQMGSVDFLKKLLDKLNVILKSLVGAIPGIGSALTELKDIAEKEIVDTEEHVPLVKLPHQPDKLNRG